jgi:hypothetical protein
MRAGIKDGKQGNSEMQVGIQEMKPSIEDMKLGNSNLFEGVFELPGKSYFQCELQ